jgi:hypothetical protein
MRWRPYIRHGRRQFEIGVKRRRSNGRALHECEFCMVYRFIRIEVQ